MSNLISPKGESFIKAKEGWRDTAYFDATGTLTIGWGHTSDARFPVRKGMKINMAEGQAMFDWDIQQAATFIKSHVSTPMNGNQMAAIISFVFNVGNGAFLKSTLLRVLQKGQFDQVPFQLSRWNRSKGRVLAGLTRRRTDESILFNTPVSGSVPSTPVETKYAVEESQGKSAMESSTVWTSVIMGGSAVVSTIVSTFQQVKDVVGPQGLAILVAAICVIGAAYVISERLRHSKQNGV